MGNSELKELYGTLFRVTRNIEEHGGDSSEMLLCELDEQRMNVAEHIAWNIALDNMKEAGGENLEDFIGHAKNQVRNELAGAEDIL